MRPITERLSPAVRILVIAYAVLFAFYALVPPAQVFFREHLALGPALVRGEFWQPLTALFVHLDFISFAFNVLGLWFVGGTMERELGTRRFLTLFFGAGVVANVVMAALGIATGFMGVTAGASLAVLGLFVAFGTVYGRTPTRVLGGLVVEARTLTLILVGFAILADLMRGAWVALAGDVAAIVTAFFLSGGGLRSVRRSWDGWRAKRTRRKYQILEGGRSGKRGGGESSRPTYLN